MFLTRTFCTLGALALVAWGCGGASHPNYGGDTDAGRSDRTEVLDGQMDGKPDVGVATDGAKADAGTDAVEHEGPVLTIVAPQPTQIVGGRTTFAVHVEAAAGIDDDSVILEFSETGQSVSMGLPRTSGEPLGTSGDFGVDYDTANLPYPMIFPQVLFSATDREGKEAHISYQIAVDNTPPRVSLTSPDIYPAKKIDCWGMCGDAVCDKALGEDARSCPEDCSDCGDGFCGWDEDCPEDCAAGCGDDVCDPNVGETVDTCQGDCLVRTCGDGVCAQGENCTSCPDDCGLCRLRPCDEDGKILACARPMPPLANVERANGTRGMDVRIELADGITVPQAIYSRVRVQDCGNRVTGATVVPVAGTDPSGVRLYILPHDTLPLVIGKDGTCAGINPNLIETASLDPDLTERDPHQVLVLDMMPVPPNMGEPNFRPWDKTLAPIPEECGVAGDPQVSVGPAAPCSRLPGESQAQWVMEHPGIPGESAIYAPAPVEGTDLMCQGPQVDLGYVTGLDVDRWICIAVVARDNAGNKSVSRPLHVCLSRNWESGGECDQTPEGTCVGTEPDQPPTGDCDIDPPYEDDLLEVIRIDR